jgi:hypothetical protein
MGQEVAKLVFEPGKAIQNQTAEQIQGKECPELATEAAGLIIFLSFNIKFHQSPFKKPDSLSYNANRIIGPPLSRSVD